MPASILTHAAAGRELEYAEVDGNFAALKAAIDSVTDAATDTTITDTAAGKIMLDIAGVPKKISVDNLVAAISTPASGLAVAAALSDSNIITISQDGGATEVRTTLAALKAYIGAVATVPGAPTGVTATAGNASASVAFTAPSDGGSAITGYTVTSSPGSFTGTGSAPPISVNGLTNGTAYTFTVTATNAIGTGSASSPSSAVTPSAGATAPGQVTGLTLGTATSTTQPLTWTAPSNGGSAITDYVVQWSPAGAGTWTAFADGTSTTAAATVTGLTASTSYDYRVAAVNAIGTGTNSATATGSTAASSIPDYLFAPTAYSFATGGVISVSGYWGGGSTIYVKTAGGVTPANAKMAWGTSPTVPPAQYSDTSVGGRANAILPCVRTGGWVQGGAKSQGFYGLYAPNGSLFAFGSAGTYYLWVLTDDGFSKAYDNNTGTPIGVVLT